MGQVSDAPNESHLPPLPINSTPPVSAPGTSSSAAAVTSDSTSSTLRGPATVRAEFGHPHRQIVVPLFGHHRSVPPRAARHTAGETRCAQNA